MEREEAKPCRLRLSEWDHRTAVGLLFDKYRRSFSMQAHVTA